MHELTLTSEVCKVVAEASKGQRVTAVHLEIGKLSGVYAEAIRFCFELVSAEFPELAGAALHITEPEGRARCRRCEQSFTLHSALEACPCGSFELDWISGRGLIIQAMEVTSCAESAAVRA